MNLTSSVRIAYEDLRSIAFGDISGSYAIVGPLFQNPVRILEIHNTTNQNIIISFNGLDDQSFLAASTAKILDYGSNMSSKAGLLEQPAFQGVWIKAEDTLPTEGSVYVEVIYAAQA